MAVTALSESPQVHRFPQSKYVDAVRWLPPVLPLKRFAVVAFFNTDSDSDPYFIEIQSLSSNPLNLNSHSSWVSPSRISSLKTSQSHYVPLVVAGTFAGSLHVLSAGSVDGASLEPVLSVPEKVMHNGPVSCLDLMDGGVECVIVGEDGRVNLVSIGDSRLNHRRVFDSSGLVSYTAAKWGSPTEFATGGYGYSLQWWDQRKPDGAVSQFKGSWPAPRALRDGPSEAITGLNKDSNLNSRTRMAQRKTSGIVHSIDIHPSRKHTCLAGGSLGTVFAWDLRWPQQPIVLSGLGAGNTEHSPSESEVWEVQYDRFAKSSNVGNISSSRILPAMICSEDGILSVVEQGEEPIELLAEPCAINSFDIDRQNPSVSRNCAGCDMQFGVGIYSNTDKAQKCIEYLGRILLHLEPSSSVVLKLLLKELELLCPLNDNMGEISFKIGGFGISTLSNDNARVFRE
ncbi:hypothetical protein FEM48_Zijuj01G0167600 [Ziziphus jujuba var. spinosa]|uniref:Nuclear pore complex protein NUP43 n=1 Tax=Ziziphus jujuba var. spinosa TaxID=714518 RepID=A0A978W2E3_ZIZJJ|nr:hypothetical protein FEM48_Zijuj01G0167600 [Ziziphus jujuba var. spinosa]